MTDATTQPLDLDAIRNRLDATTPGPWKAGGRWMRPWELTIAKDYPLVELDPTPRGQADAAFIAHARDDVPELLAEVERLRGEAVDLLADLVVKCTEYGTQDGDFVAFYLLPTGPVHRAIPWLEQRGITVRPGFDGREGAG